MFNSNYINHLFDVPYLGCNKLGDFPLLILDKCLQDHHHASINIGAHLRFARELAADINEKTAEMHFKYRIPVHCIFFDEGLYASPEFVDDTASSPGWLGYLLETVRLFGVFRRCLQFFDQGFDELIELLPERMFWIVARLFDEGRDQDDEPSHQIGVCAK